MASSSANTTKTRYVKDRLQALDPVTGRYVKIEKATGRILSQKKSPGPHKNIKIITNKNK